jgi:hypothetical protein
LPDAEELVMTKRLNVQIAISVLILGMLLMPTITVLGQGDETVSVTSLRAPVHTEPSAQSETLVTLPRGTLLSFVGFDESLNWVQIETEDAVSGWVSAAHVRLNGPYVPPADGYTRTAIDGVGDDWGRFLRPYADLADDSTGEIDVQAVVSFINDQYLYVLVDLEGDAREVALLLVDIVGNNEGVYTTYQFALPQGRSGTVFVVTDDAGAARDASSVIVSRAADLEFRMPLELLDSPPAANIVAVRVEENTASGMVMTDELVEIMPTVVTLETEPGMDAEIVDYRVNLRAEPVSGQIIQVLEPGTRFSLSGRTADGGWLHVRLPDASTGWVSAAYVGSEVDLMMLPEIQ